jgi:hypothetical protein
MFNISYDQDILVCTAGNLGWDLSNRRCFGPAEMVEWEELMSKLEVVSLSEVDDSVIWKLEHSGKYSTRSLYRFITFAGVYDIRMMEIWSTNVPLKVQIFLWMA